MYRTGFISTALCTILFATFAHAEVPADLSAARVKLDPDQVQWRYLKLKARKFLLTATSEAWLNLVDLDQVRNEIIPPEQGVGVVPEPRLVRLKSTTRFFGRKSDMSLLMNPTDGRAVQEALDHRGGDRTKHRIFRYTDTGIFVLTYRPMNDLENRQPWPNWTRISPEWRTIEKQAYGLPIVLPFGLLYVVGAADIGPDRPPLQLLSISDRKITYLKLTAHNAPPRKVDFMLTGPNGSRRCKGKLSAIRIGIEGQPVDPTLDTKFEFLGLEEDIAIYIEPQTRIILEVSGKAPIVGHLVIRVKEAKVTGTGGCPLL